MKKEASTSIDIGDCAYRSLSLLGACITNDYVSLTTV